MPVSGTRSEEPVIKSRSFDRLLHPDLWQQVTCHLPPSSIAALARVSRRVRQLVIDDAVWLPICTRFIKQHSRPQEKFVPVDLAKFDSSSNASWWRLWWAFLMVHRDLLGFWALDAPTTGRLLVVRISPSTGTITAEMLQRCTTSEAACIEFDKMQSHTSELRGGLLTSTSGELGYFYFREQDFQHELCEYYRAREADGDVNLLEPSVETTLVFDVTFSLTSGTRPDQFAVRYWRDGDGDPDVQRRERIVPRQAEMVDIRPRYPHNSIEAYQTIDIRPELQPTRPGWHAMCPLTPTNSRRADRVIKSIQIGFEPGALHLGRFRRPGNKTQYEQGHYRPVYCPLDPEEARLAFPEAQLAALAGLWVGSYSAHGPEIIYFRPSAGPSAFSSLEGAAEPVVLEAIKVTGDANVPCGIVTFQIFPSVLGNSTPIPAERRPLHIPPWPLRSTPVQPMGPVLHGQGRIAARGYDSPGWSPCTVGIMNADQIVVQWTELLSITVFTRMTGM